MMLSNTLPPDRVLLAPADRRAAVLGLIRNARTRLTMSLFRCNDKEVFREIAGAVDRGVEVEVLVTSRAKGGRKKLHKLWQRLEDTGATVCAYNDPVVKYHAKYAVADDGPALVASLNLTKKCFSKTCDAVVLTWDPEVVTGLRRLTASDRDGIPPPASLSPRLILGPETARRQFTALIRQARSSILMIDPKLSDPDLMALLEERRSSGVQVHVHQDCRVGSLKSHGKVMLIDGTIAVIGSLALTALSIDFRREVAIIVTEPSAVAGVQSLFASLGVSAGEPGQVPASAGGASC